MFSNERRVSNHLQGMRSDGVGLFALQEVYGMIHRLLDPEEGGQDDDVADGDEEVVFDFLDAVFGCVVYVFGGGEGFEEEGFCGVV